MKVTAQDGGLAFFWLAGVWWRYLVCHFGASWSAWWWGRVSGALVRLLHAFLGKGHMAFNYVDDTVVFVRAEVAWETAALIGMYMEMLGVPLSWHKLGVGISVQYIGIVINLREVSLGLSADKVAHLQRFLALIKKGNRLDKKGLERGVGQLQWATAIAPWLRSWLSSLYRMMHMLGLRWGWLDEAGSREVFNAMDEDGTLGWDAGGFARGMSLSFVGKRTARSKDDWRTHWGQGKGSVAFADWEARRVKVTQEAVVMAGLWQKYLSGVSVSRRLWRPWAVPGDAAADAFASGDWASLGGWWVDEGVLDKATCWWYRLEIHRDDSAEWVTIKGDLQDDIAFFECLAQVVLLALRVRGSSCNGGRLVQGCDNQTSVGALQKRLSTKYPLATAVQAMSVWEHTSEVVADLRYLPGVDNEAADQLSRWRQKGLSGFSQQREKVVSLADVLGPCPVASM